MILKIKNRNILNKIKGRAFSIASLIQDFEDEYQTLKEDTFSELLWDIEIDADQIIKFIKEIENEI